MKQILSEIALLLRMEILVSFREAKTSRLFMLTIASFFGLLLLGGEHVVGLLLAATFRDRLEPESLRVGEAVGWLLVALVMLRVASGAVLSLLAERRERQLLLTSPIHPASVHFAALVVIVVKTVASVALVAVPYFDIMAITYSPTYLFGYGVLVMMATIVATTAIMTEAVFITVLGLRVARAIMRFSFSMAACIAFAIPFAPVLFGRSFSVWLIRIGAAGSNTEAMRVIVRATRGDIGSLGILSVIAIGGVLCAAIVFSAKKTALDYCVATSGRTKTRGDHSKFRRSSWIVVYSQCWRLFLREPMVTVRTVPVIFGAALVPIVAVRLLHGIFPVAITLQFAALLAAVIGAVMTSINSAPQLYRMSPEPRKCIKYAMVAAASTIPALIIGFVFVIEISFLGVTGCLLGFGLGAMLAANIAWIEVDYSMAQGASDIVKLAKQVVLALVGSSVGAVAIGLVGRESGLGAVAFVIALTVSALPVLASLVNSHKDCAAV